MKKSTKFACVAFAGAMLAAMPIGLVGCGPQPKDLSTEVNGDIAYLTDNVYNKLAEDLTFANMSAEQKEGFYTEVGSVKAEEEAKFKIGDIEFDGEEYALSVGMDKRITAPRYFVNENKLYVASYFLGLKADNNGKLNFNYGSTNFNLMISKAPKAEIKAGDATSQSTANTIAQKADKNEYDINITDSTKYFSFKFTSNDKAIQPNLFITEKIVNDKVDYGFTTSEADGTFAFYATKYGSTDAQNFVRDYKIMPIGYQTVSVRLNINQVANA